MAELKLSSLKEETQLPPLLRLPGELLVEIYRHADHNDQMSFSCVCSVLREAGLPEIFRYLTFDEHRPPEATEGAEDENEAARTAWDAERARKKADLLLLVHSPHRNLVRSLSYATNFDLKADVREDPLCQSMTAYLHLFPNLTRVRTILLVETLRMAHRHANLEVAELLSLDSEPDPWAMVLHKGSGNDRRINPLTILPVQMLVFDWDGPDGVRSSWMEWKGGSEMSVPVRHFIEQTQALNLVTPVVTLYGLANVPIPADSALATTRFPHLGSLDLVGVDLPTPDFLDSIERVVSAQRPGLYFALRLATAHPVPTSISALGQLVPFRQLVKVLDFDRLQHGQVTVEIRAANEENQWDVTRLSLGVDGGAVVPRFLTSLGAELKNLSRLEIAASSDPSSQLEIKWPKDWDTVVTAFRSLPHLTYLGLGSSLTPHETYTNDIACCDATFSQLANTHPALHERTLASGGWWVAWKRLGCLLNLHRVRRLGPSLPEGCEVIWFSPVLEMWKGSVVAVETEAGRKVKGIVGGQSSPDLQDGSEEDVQKKAFVDGECREMMQGWRCFACGGVGQEKDLFESVDACGRDEVDKALWGEWKTAWTRDDLRAEHGA